MSEHSLLVILVEIFAISWWGVYVYSRRQTEKARRAEAAKYAVWDAAYRQALKSGKTEYYAMLEAVKTVHGGSRVLKVWDDAYNASIKDGTKKYRATLIAIRAARRAAHN
jgi:hypothetical protein